MQIEVAEDGFVAMLVAHGALDELDRELIKCNSAIFDLGGKAEITIKTKIARVPKLETAVDTMIDVKSKYPEHKRPNRTMFVTPGNGVTDQFQEQKPLGLGNAVQQSSTLTKASVASLTTLNKAG